MSFLRGHWTPHRVWLSIFGVWIFLLSGALNSWFRSPGLWQMVRLKSFLAQQQALVVEAENQLIALSAEQVRLERSGATQQQEIRRVLGYVRPDELIFDFTQGASSRFQTATVAHR